MISILILVVDDVDKIAYLFQTYNDEMLRYAKRLLWQRNDPEHDAEDVMGGVWWRLSKYRKSVNIDVTPLEMRAYVMRIVAHQASCLMKTPEALPLDVWQVEEESNRDFLEQIHIRDRYDEVVYELKKLDDRYSVPLELMLVEHMSVKQISIFLDIPLKTVYTNIERGKKQLINAMNRKEIY